jgi:hypothetical protein
MKNSLFFTLFFLSISCHSQKKETFSYKKVSNTLVSKISTEEQIDLKSFMNLTKYLPKGYSIDGKIDYTYYIQKGLDENRKVIFPNFPVLVNYNGLKLKSNSQLVFQNKSKIQIIPNSLEKYQILDIRNVENIVIFNPKLRGERDRHKGTKGEWGMGINIISSKNITIYNPYISDCWGDGIYISRSSLKQSENVKIHGGIIDFNRRNGISIISGKNISVENVLISNSYGTLPMAGLDIEPNGNEDVLENIIIKNLITFNNAEIGVGIVLINLIGKRSRNVSMQINNHSDYFSKSSFLISGFKSVYQKDILPIEGFVIVKNSKWIDSKDNLKMGKSFKYAPKYSISGIKIVKNGEINEELKIDTQRELIKRNIDTN